MSIGFGADGGSYTHYTNRIGDLFHPLYRRLFDENGSFVVNLSDKLAEARMDWNVGLYLSLALAVGLVGGFTLWWVGILVGFLLFGTGLIEVGVLIGFPVGNPTVLALIEAARVPGLIVLGGVVFGTIGFVLAFGALVLQPYSKAAARRREINLLLPDAVSYMYALSVGGMNQLEILETMADAEDTYGEVAREFRTIIQETEYFDTDYRTAIQTQAGETASEELSQFLTDMLSLLDSGGDLTAFLDDKKDLHFRTAKEEQERILDTLELFAEMYITLSLFPLLLIIVLVIMSMIGQAQQILLYATVYALIPLISIGFLILVSTIKQDELGDGYLRSDSEAVKFDGGADAGILNLGLIERFADTYYIFDRIRSREGTYQTVQVLTQPHYFFRDHPLYTLAITTPVAIVLVVIAALSGATPTTWAGVIDQPVWSTFIYVYVPLFVVCIPLAVFREWSLRSRYAILNNLSANLRKLASANATGLTLLESIKVVADTSPGKLGEEFETMYVKSTYGMHLNESLLVFNNKYHIPRLARTVKLIGKAHETSSEISSVLSTAAKNIEAQEDIERDRRSRAMMHVAVILMTFFTLLAVMAVLKVQFIDVMVGLTAEAAGDEDVANRGFAAAIDADLLSMLFFHAVTIQAIMSGLISGYIRDAKLVSGVKYVVLLLLASLGVWMVVG